MVRQRAWSNRTIHKSLREHSPQGRSDYVSLSVHEDVVAPLCWASVVRSNGIQRIHGIPSEDLLCCAVFHCDYLILVATVEHEVVVASRCLWSHVKIAEDERLVAVTHRFLAHFHGLSQLRLPNAVHLLWMVPTSCSRVHVHDGQVTQRCVSQRNHEHALVAKHALERRSLGVLDQSRLNERVLANVHQAVMELVSPLQRTSVITTGMVGVHTLHLLDQARDLCVLVDLLQRDQIGA
mmetsp:Transcript_173857/g.557234  ORF Transcript_173857/g.557234 Transcript_173857/m.557234 type:complete len:237 (+) Transcript_173857:675-1385(+)